MTKVKKPLQSPPVFIFLILTAVIATTFLPLAVCAGTETLITTGAGSSNQIFPAISGSWIV